MGKYSTCCLKIAGTDVSCAFEFKETEKYFRDYLSEAPGDNDCVSVSEASWDLWEKLGRNRTPYAEYTCITSAISDRLLFMRRCIIHAVAFRDDEAAWLIAAASGVGKTTQMRTLLELYPGRFSVICGDRPALQLMDDGSVFVHPTPWNGKENMRGAGGAGLRGIICLKRGCENRIEYVPPRRAVTLLYESLIHTGDSEQDVRNAAGFEDSLLMRVPVWEFTGREVPESTKLLYEKLLR